LYNPLVEAARLVGRGRVRTRLGTLLAALVDAYIRAAAAIKHLQTRISGLTDAPVPLRSGVTLEIVRVPQIDTDAYLPPVWADAAQGFDELAN